MSSGIVTHRPGYRKVVFSGVGHPEGDLETQTRTTLSLIRDGLEDLGGGMQDVTMLRFFVRDDVLSSESQLRIHEVRSDFFDRPQYPAATMVGVSELLYENMLIEVETEAEIPDDEWDVDVIDDTS
ncbi:RidA family protein [Natronobacterium texcoconense]|nr:RidA family protein [Natronobacterium texcoconense]